MNIINEGKVSRILVVDDDEMLNFLFCSFLSSKGFEMLSASGITEAKNILESDDQINLILLDYQLEDGVGMDLLQPQAMMRYKSIAPVIMISANEDPEFLEQCFSGGVNDYIIKPVNLSLLALKVDALIKSISMQELIRSQNAELESFKAEAEREEQVAIFTYEYLLRQNSCEYDGISVWLKSFAAFSGDMALVKKSPSGNLYFMLLDATGHGLSAAITIMPVVTIFNSMVSKGFHAQRIVTEINRKLVTDTPMDKFVAAILIELNPFRRELSVWNGGMPPVYWVNKGIIEREFHSQHMSLGIMDDDMFDASVVTIDLPDEGYLFSYSDGLNEQENPEGEQFSIERIKAIIQRDPSDICQELAVALRDFACVENYTDDVSVCVIEPSRVFNDLSDSIVLDDKELNSEKKSNTFSWNIKLAGLQLEACEIPTLCNHFLQQIGFDQQYCQKVFSIVAEMVSNALDHGVLQLSSELKESPDGFANYFVEREKRLSALTDKDFVCVSMHWDPATNGGCLVVEVVDSGPGYTPKQSDSSDRKYSGRGSHLISHLSHSVEIIPPGNKIRATIK